MARPPKITNENILSVARQVFLEQGLGASTLVIAERAGISEASIFKRFPTKQALFLAAMGINDEPDWVSVLINQMPTANIRSELTEICQQMLAFYQEFLPRILFLPRVLMTLAKGKLPNPPPFLPPPIRHRQLLAGFLERAIDKGYLRRSCDPLTVSSMIIGGLTSYVLAHTVFDKVQSDEALPQYPPLDPDMFAQNLIETLWAGIAPDK